MRGRMCESLWPARTAEGMLRIPVDSMTLEKFCLLKRCMNEMVSRMSPRGRERLLCVLTLPLSEFVPMLT